MRRWMMAYPMAAASRRRSRLAPLSALRRPITIYRFVSIINFRRDGFALCCDLIRRWLSWFADTRLFGLGRNRRMDPPIHRRPSGSDQGQAEKRIPDRLFVRLPTI